MKQVIQNYKTGELKIEEVPSPCVLGQSLLVQNEFSLISAGTEKSTVDMAKKSLIGKAQARPDLVKKVVDQVQKDGIADTFKLVMGRLDATAAMGYTCAGVVRGVGSDVTGYTIGEKVACAGQNYASHAEQVSVPKNLCVKIPEGVDLEDAAYVAIGSIALQGVRQAEPRLGETVAVIGLGLLGQIVSQLLKANGCKVIVSDLDEKKRLLAMQLGADLAVDADGLVEACRDATNYHGVDVVVITASTKSSQPVEVAGEICRQKGRVVVVGAVGMTLPREAYYAKELELRLSCSYGPGRYDTDYEEKGQDYPYGYVRWTEQRNMAAFLDLVAQNKVNLKALTTHTFDIESAAQAYEMLTKQNESYLGILIRYPAGSGSQLSNRIDLRVSPEDRPLHLGLIGAGNHIKDKLLPHLKKHPNVAIRAICTNSGVSARATADKIEAAYCTTDFHEIIKDEKVDAIIIGTRHDSHASLILESLKKGKHVFVEKPLCLNMAELEEIDVAYAAAAKQGQLLRVGFNRRFSSHAEKIRNFYLSRTNPLTMIYRVNAGFIDADHWIQDMSTGGGRIIGEACHFVDFMQFICGRNPTHVYASAVGSNASCIIEDKAIITLNFADGSIGTIIYCADGDKALGKERFEAFADGQSVVMNDFINTEFYSHGKRDVYKSRSQDKGFKAELDVFLADIVKGAAIDYYSQARVCTMATIKAVESMVSKRSIELLS